MTKTATKGSVEFIEVTRDSGVLLSVTPDVMEWASI